jgi:hypothetical protein
MSWSVEFLEARRRLIDSDDYQRQRSLGHELSDGSIDTPLGSDVPSGVRFQCRFCGSVIRFGNSNWDSGAPAAWHLSEISGGPADESCEARRDRRPRNRAARTA